MQDFNLTNIKIKTDTKLIGAIDLPYFENENISIYNEDILEINSIQNSSVDLIITSPPYNVDIHYNSHADDLTYEDYLEFTQKWIKKYCHAN